MRTCTLPRTIVRLMPLACLAWAHALATEIIGLSVEAQPDGAGEVTCLVDSDAGVAKIRLAVRGADGAVAFSQERDAEFFVNWASPSTRKCDVEFKVPQVTPWTDETPAMYVLEAELLGPKGERRAFRRTRFAFRRLELRADDGLYVNGRRMRLRGINPPAESWPEEVEARAAACKAAVREVRWLNANAIWCTNAVPDELLEACDEAGLYVVGNLSSVQAGAHPCAIGRSNLEGVRLVPSPSWGTLRSWARSKELVMACPLLPQEGEGGLGAGLADCWTAMCAAPLCVGGVLQAKPGWTAAELGAHGRAIRETWSPVACSRAGLVQSFTSRRLFVGLDGHRYTWQALGFDEGRERVLAEGGDACPMVRPGGSAQTRLPPVPRGTQALRVTVFDRLGEAVCSWDFVEPVSCSVKWPKGGCPPPPGLEDVYMLACARTNRVRNARGRVMQSPALDVLSPPESSLEVTWGRMADGTYRFDYKLACRANVEMLGLAFPAMEDVVATRWLGRGPHRTWGNLAAGQQFGVWQGADGARGFHADARWLEVETVKGTYRFEVAKGPDILADMSPRDDFARRVCAMPPFGPGVFARIPGIGGDSFAANETGPAGCGGWVHHMGHRQLMGTLLVRWTPSKTGGRKK